MELGAQGYIPWVYNESGHLDIEYLFPELMSKFQENKGIDIAVDGLKLADGITSIDINGKYVKLKLDENGALKMTIDEPEVCIPSFNEANNFGSALVYIENEIVSGMIVPDRTDLALDVYGDWEAGQVVSGINWNGNNYTDILSLSTYGPVFTPDKTSYFEVLVLDGNGTLFSSFKSNVIKSSTRRGQPMDGTGYYVDIFIDDFKDEAEGYSFKPTFNLNMIKIVTEQGGRFKIKIIHHVGTEEHSYISNDLLYNHGEVPRIGSASIQLITDSSSSSVGYSWCSGVKYVTNGRAILSVNNVSDLNKMAAVSSQIEYEMFDILKIASENPVTSVNNNLMHNNTLCAFSIKFDIKEDVFNNEVISGVVRVKNAFASSTDTQVKMNLLVNSKTDLRRSDDLHEYFTDEQYRVLSDFTPASDGVNVYSQLMPWDSAASLKEFDNGRGLMVVPGVGVSYPHGDWSTFIPPGPDYEATSSNRSKFFARQFTGNSKLKFGGTFVIEGLSKNQLLDDRVSMIISPDNGADWFDLKTVRNVESVSDASSESSSVVTVGVMTDVYEKDGKLFIEWAYPSNSAYSGTLYFKLGMKDLAPYCIKSISLLNTDVEEGW